MTEEINLERPWTTKLYARIDEKLAAMGVRRTDKVSASEERLPDVTVDQIIFAALKAEAECLSEYELARQDTEEPPSIH